MTDVPSNLVPTRITELTEYTGTSTLGYLPYVLNGVTYKVQFANIAAVGAVPSTRTITGGSGLAGGGDLSADRVIYLADGGVTFSKLADSGVVAGVYGSATEIPVLTVDQKGRVTIASTTPINLSNYVTTSRAILAGAGLTGGGTLAADRTLSIDFSNATPQSLGVPTAGVATQASRADHVHPAVDLSDTTETTGALPLARGGTGSSLSPVAGAILYSDGSNIDLSNPGTTNQFLISQGTGAPDWVDLTGGTTGMTFTFVGSDCVLGGTLAVANGGTGAVTASGARVNLLPSYVGNATKVLAVNASETDVEWVTGGGGGSGTVTSVAMTVPTGLQVSGSPITTSGTLAVTLQSGYSIPTTASQTNWDTAYTDRLKWDGGATGLVAATGRTSLGGTTVGSNFFTLTNPSAITFPRINADNSVSTLDAATFRTAIGAGTGNGTVTSIDASGGTTGLTFSGGPITTSGTLTLSGTLDVDNGGTGQTTYTDGQLLIGNSTGNTLTKSTLTAGSGITITNGAGSITIAATGGGGSGTVTSVDVSGGTTGLTFSGGPVTTSGTITMAGTLDADNGGTGQSSYAVGDILYANTTTTLAKLADVATGNALISGGVSTAPSWGKIGLTTHVSGTLPIGNGGTGVSSTPTNGQLLIGNGTNFSLATLTAGTNITITNSAGGITIAASGGGSLLGQTDSATPFETSLGYQAGNVNTGVNNTFVGYQSGLGNTTGTNNTAVGYQALDVNTVGTNNTAVGSSALGANTTGVDNTAVGSGALDVNTIGVRNTAVGKDALGSNTTGYDNIAIGIQSLFSNTTGFQNIAIGTYSLYSQQTSYSNVAIGWSSGNSTTTGDENVIIGDTAGYNVTTGSSNTIIGAYAGVGSSGPTLTTGSNNIIIGKFSQPSSNTVSNEITLGDANITSLRIPGLQATATTGDVLTFDGSKIVLQAGGGGGGLLGITQNTYPYFTALGYQAGPSVSSDGNAAVGYRALFSCTSGAANSAFGSEALENLTTGYLNGAFGQYALRAATNSSGNNAFGYSAMNAVTTGQYNTGIGDQCGATLTTGSNNIVIGSGADVSAATVSNEITLGNSSITSLRIPGLQAGATTGDVLTFDGSKIILQAGGGGGGLTGQTDSATPYETSLGYQAGDVNTGVNNTFIGYQAGLANTTGTDNTAVGYQALDTNTVGTSNTAIGAFALTANTTGLDNTAVGYGALDENTTGRWNAALGKDALGANINGYYNVAIGGNSIPTCTNGYYNVGIGYNSFNTASSISNSIAIGQSAGSCTTVEDSVFAGYAAGRGTSIGYSIGLGSYCLGGNGNSANSANLNAVAIGYASLGSISTGTNCTSVGYNSLYNVSTGSRNSAFGSEALYANTTSSDNVGLGYRAGRAVSTGEQNTFVGSYAGYTGTNNLTTGSNNTLIGYNAEASSSTVSNEITLGDASIATLRCQVTTITSLSDARDKTDIQPLAAGLDFVNALNPVAFTWNMRDGAKVGVPDTGFIAQDLKAVQEQTGIDIPGLVYESNPDKLEAGYGKLLPVLVKAIQELSAKVAELEAKVK